MVKTIGTFKKRHSLKRVAFLVDSVLINDLVVAGAAGASCLYTKYVIDQPHNI